MKGDNMAETLPKENQILMIINCAKIWQEVEREEIYICPASGGSYNFRPSRYFGLYRNRKVSHVANIEAVLDVQEDDTSAVRWLLYPFKLEQYQQKAVEYSNRLRSKNEFPLRVLLLSKPQQTDFRKDSQGGLSGSVRYFDVSELSVESAGYLAHKLSGKNWSQVGTVGQLKSQLE